MLVNRRRERRSRVNGAYSICFQNGEGLNSSVEAQGCNLSSSGIGIRSENPLSPGTVVFVQGPGGSPNGYCTVRHCSRDGNLNQLGLEFSEETKESVQIATTEVTDYYEFLQISPKAEAATIQRIYRFMAARFHPDNPDTGDADKFVLLNRIYDELSDPQRRAEYDASRKQRETDPVFEVSVFVDGIDGEVNRRLAILALLYNKRRTNSREPSVSMWDLEHKMAMPREYLEFATWYLKAKGYINLADNADLALTATGVDYVEANSVQNPMLHKLLGSGNRIVPGFGAGQAKEYRHGQNGQAQLDVAAEDKSDDAPGKNGSLAQL